MHNLLSPLTIALTIFLVWIVDIALLKRKKLLGVDNELQRQSYKVLLIFVGLACTIIFLPQHILKFQDKINVLMLLGVFVSAIFTLSSTTFVSNALAGFMQRSINSFQIGDFIKVGDHFGRVTERGLLHTEIQTEESDLMTFPNLLLVTQPIKVIRSSGTIISATVSLGYDISHVKVKEILLQAAKETELSDPFVHILELGDFSILYRACGFLSQPKLLLTTKSVLREKMIEKLHDANIEILSPTFVNQRQFKPADTFIPQKIIKEIVSSTETETPENVVFEKAEKVEKIEDLKSEQLKKLDEIKELESQINDSKNEEAQEAMKRKIADIQTRISEIKKILEKDSEE